MVVDGWVAETDVTRARTGRALRRARRRAAARHEHAPGRLARGPDTGLLLEDVARRGVPVLAAGGIATLDDLRTLRDLGCEGAVVGSALWSGRFGLAEAIDAISISP